MDEKIEYIAEYIDEYVNEELVRTYKISWTDRPSISADTIKNAIDAWEGGAGHQQPDNPT